MSAVLIPFPQKTGMALARLLATCTAISPRAERHNVEPMIFRAALVVAFMALDKGASTGHAIAAGYRALGAKP